MPKKRSYNFKRLQGASTSQNGNVPASEADTRPSVNERLSELRRQETAAANDRKREIAELVNQKSVPPSLRGILGVPESVPPKPKPGTSFGRRVRGVQSTPGPAPPKSWLQSSHHAARWNAILTLHPNSRRPTQGLQQVGDTRHGERTTSLMRFARMTIGRERNTGASPPSLVHLALRTAAQQWDLFDEDDLPALVDLPARLRVDLMSYIGYYGPPIDIRTFEAMTAGDEGVSFLDLAGLISHGSLNLTQLGKSMKQNGDSSASLVGPRIAESWDQEDEAPVPVIHVPVKPQFSQLTHLSLADAPAHVSWKALLSVSKLVPTLTHLSLARWPRPTLTPGLVKATVSNKLGPEVAAGGSHYYSGLDHDFREPWAILRQLSANLLRLQWLDLEGCTEWIPALAHDTNPRPTRHEQSTDVEADPWLRQTWIGNIFLESWKNVGYVQCGRGWVPTLDELATLPKDEHDSRRQYLIENVSRSVRAAQVHEVNVLEVDFREDPYDIARRRTEMWVDSELRVIRATDAINSLRRAESCKPVHFDFGWTQKLA